MWPIVTGSKQWNTPGLAQGTNKSSWESENGTSAVKLNSISPYLSWIAWFMWLENRSNHHQAGRQMCHEWAHYKMFHCFLTPLYVLSDVIATHSGLWKLYPPSLFSRQAYTVIFPLPNGTSHDTAIVYLAFFWTHDVPNSDKNGHNSRHSSCYNQ